MSDDDKLDRREFLQRAGIAGMLAVGAGRFAAGCKKGGSSKSGSSGEEKSAGTSGSEKGGGEITCDKSGLKESEKKTRESLKYVDHSDKPDKDCANCKLYEPPKEEGTCGTCTSVPGPIHPDGYCTAWVKKA